MWALKERLPFLNEVTNVLFYFRIFIYKVSKSPFDYEIRDLRGISWGETLDEGVKYPFFLILGPKFVGCASSHPFEHPA